MPTEAPGKRRKSEDRKWTVKEKSAPWIKNIYYEIITNN